MLCSASIALHALLHYESMQACMHQYAVRIGTCIALHALHAQGELKAENEEQGEETGSGPSDPLKALRGEVQASCAELRCMHN